MDMFEIGIPGIVSLIVILTVVVSTIIVSIVVSSKEEETPFNGLKILSMFLPLIGYIAGMIQARDKVLYKIFMKYSTLGIFINLAIIGIVVLAVMNGNQEVIETVENEVLKIEGNV